MHTQATSSLLLSLRWSSQDEFLGITYQLYLYKQNRVIIYNYSN